MHIGQSLPRAVENRSPATRWGDSLRPGQQCRRRL